MKRETSQGAGLGSGQKRERGSAQQTGQKPQHATLFIMAAGRRGGARTGLTTLSSLHHVRQAGHEIVLVVDAEQLKQGELSLKGSLTHRVQAPASRSELNRLVMSATGEVLVFLPPDARASEDFPSVLADMVADTRAAWGWFRLAPKGCVRPWVARVLNGLARVRSVPEPEHGLWIDRRSLASLGGLQPAAKPLRATAQMMRFKLPSQVAATQLRSSLWAFRTHPELEIIRRFWSRLVEEVGV